MELRKEEPTFTVDAWKNKLIYIRYDFDSNMNCSMSDFNSAVNNVGTIPLKVSMWILFHWRFDF
jgi:hypothetical protein